MFVSALRNLAGAFSLMGWLGFLVDGEVKMGIPDKSERSCPGNSVAGRFGSWVDRTPVWRLFLLILIIGATVRGGALTLWPCKYVQILESHVEARNIAISLARTGEFANPFRVPTGKTAHLEPLAPFLTSLIYRAWGVSPRAEFIRGIVCALFSTLTCGLTVLLGLELGLGRLVSLCAGTIAALAPHGVQLVSDLTELNGCLGTALFICAVILMLQAKRYAPSPLRLIASGVLSGLTILTCNSLLAPLAVLIVCAALPIKWNPLRLPLKSVIVIVLSTTLVVIPWSVRNLLVFNQWVTVRSNFGLEFRLAQNDLSGEASMQKIHPANSQETRELIRRVGEPAAYAALGRDGLKWVRAHPIEFAERTLKRVVYFWIPRTRPLRYVASFAVALGALWGFTLLVIRMHRAALIVGILWLTFPAVYYLVLSYARYQQPMAFSLYLMASVPISVVSRKHHSELKP